MAPAATKRDKQGQAGDKSAESRVADDLVSLLSGLTGSEVFKAAKALVESKSKLEGEIQSLKEDIEKHKNTDYTHCQMIAEQKKKFDSAKKIQAEQTAKMEELKAELEKKQAELTDKVGKIQKMGGKISKLTTELEKRADRIGTLEKAEGERDRLRTELASKTTELNRSAAKLSETAKNLDKLKSFMQALEPIDNRQAEISTSLKEAFDRATGFFRQFLGQDLPEDRLKDETVWQALGKHRDTENIPLRASNTANAQWMRVAAGLAVYARSLADHVWRPTYLSADKGVDDVLESLENEDSLHEAFARSVILRIHNNGSGYRKRDRVKHVVDAVTQPVGGLVPRDQLDDFNSGLRDLTWTICDLWEPLQQLEVKVRPSFTSVYRGDWIPLPEDLLVGHHQAEPPQGQEEDQGEATMSAQKLGPSKAMVVVWPTFLYVGPFLERLLCQGYLLTSEQMARAEDEGSSRSVRQASRQQQSGEASKHARKDSGVSGIFLGGGGSRE